VLSSFIAGTQAAKAFLEAQLGQDCDIELYQEAEASGLAEQEF